MSEPIVVEITGRTYQAERIGDCLRLIGVSGDKNGYPKGKRKNKDVRLHREVLGLKDPKIFACHTCDHPWCVEPSHLYPGTPQQNMDDKCRRGRYKGNGFRLPEWKRNLYFELEQAYGPKRAADCLGLKSAYAVSKHRRTFFK